MSEPTPSLEEFLPKYRANDNEWWYLSSGDHLNLFDEAIDGLAAANASRTALYANCQELLRLLEERDATIEQLQAQNARLVDELSLSQAREHNLALELGEMEAGDDD